MRAGSRHPLLPLVARALLFILLVMPGCTALPDPLPGVDAGSPATREDGQGGSVDSGAAEDAAGSPDWNGYKGDASTADGGPAPMVDGAMSFADGFSGDGLLYDGLLMDGDMPVADGSMRDATEPTDGDLPLDDGPLDDDGGTPLDGSEPTSDASPQDALSVD